MVLSHKNPPNSAEWAVCVSLDLWGPCIYRNLDYIFGIYMINEEKNVIWTNLCKKLHENCLISEECNRIYFNNVKHCFWEDLNSVLFSLTVGHVSNKKHLAFETSKEIHEQKLLFWQTLSHSNEWITSSAIKNSPWKF